MANAFQQQSHQFVWICPVCLFSYWHTALHNPSNSDIICFLGCNIAGS